MLMVGQRSDEALTVCEQQTCPFYAGGSKTSLLD